jgi:tellurite resistance protein
MFQDFIAAQAKVLAHVAAADGQIDAQEREHFVGFLEASPISDALRVELYELLRTPPSLAETENLIAGIPPEAVSTLLKSAYLIAHANGHLADTEVRSLDRLAMAAGVPSASLPKLHRMLELTLDAHRLEREIFSI